MIIDIDEISKQWKLDEPQLDILGQQVVSLLKKGLFAVELHPEISYRTKEIQSIIKKIQKKQKEKTYGYNDLRDRLGIRIVCPFLSDLSTIDTFLKKNFKVRKEEKKKEKIRHLTIYTGAGFQWKSSGESTRATTVHLGAGYSISQIITMFP